MKRSWLKTTETAILIFVLLFSMTSCGEPAATGKTGDPATQSGYTKLSPPIRNDVAGSNWSLTQGFGAYYSMPDGNHTGEDWNRTNDAGANIYPIAAGEIVWYGQINKSNSDYGYYIIIKHTGKFLIPVSSGSHLKASIKPNNTIGRASNGNGSPMIEMQYVFSDGTLNDYPFDLESKYSYSEETVNTIYSVYFHLNKRSDLKMNTLITIPVDDVNKPIGTLTQSAGSHSTHLHFEIRSSMIEKAKSKSGYLAVLGSTEMNYKKIQTNGYFKDNQIMVNLGYREPSSIIQANWTGGEKASNASAIIINVGDYVNFGKYYDDPILWKCVSKDGSAVMLVSEYILCQKAFDAAESGEYGTGVNDVQKLGSNIWSSSNIREWLNSSSLIVNYSTQAPTAAAIWRGYNYYVNESGFLYNFTAIERDEIKTVEHDGILDYVFLLSENEINSFFGNTNSQRKRQMTQKGRSFGNEKWSGDNYWYYWTRTPVIGYLHYLRYVRIEGNVEDHPNAAGGHLGILPALNLKYDAAKSGNGTINNPYVVN